MATVDGPPPITPTGPEGPEGEQDKTRTLSLSDTMSPEGNAPPVSELDSKIQAFILAGIGD